MGDVVDDKALGHAMLGGNVVAAAGSADVAALGAPVVVARHQLVQHRIGAVAACTCTKSADMSRIAEYIRHKYQLRMQFSLMEKSRTAACMQLLHHACK